MVVRGFFLKIIGLNLETIKAACSLRRYSQLPYTVYVYEDMVQCKCMTKLQKVVVGRVLPRSSTKWAYECDV